MKTFESMDSAVRYVEETLQLTKLQYHFGSYSWGQKWNIRLVADHKQHHVDLVYYLLYHFNYDTSPKIPIQNIDICNMAFSKLCNENKTDPAFKLYNRMVRKLPVLLEENEIDLEIELALIYCGAHPCISHKYQGVFDQNGISQVHEYQYQAVQSEVNKNE